MSEPRPPEPDYKSQILALETTMDAAISQCRRGLEVLERQINELEARVAARHGKKRKKMNAPPGLKMGYMECQKCREAVFRYNKKQLLEMQKLSQPKHHPHS